MIEWVLDNLAPVPICRRLRGDEQQFVRTSSLGGMAIATPLRARLKIVDDGSTTTRISLVRSAINLVLTREPDLAKSDLIIVAGDISLASRSWFCHLRPMLRRDPGDYDVGDLEAIKKYAASRLILPASSPNSKRNLPSRKAR